MHAVRILCMSWYFCDGNDLTTCVCAGPSGNHACCPYMKHCLGYIMRHVTARTAAATRMASGSARSTLGALGAPELYSWLVSVGGSAAGVTEMLKLKRHALA